jgi:ssDNA-binding Zn-finger/Zn-ribbon topoisomerase 1
MLSMKMNQRSLFEILEDDNEPSSFEGSYIGAKSRFVGYSAYIQSNDWRKKRKYVLGKLGHECQRCGAKDKSLQVHHKHYKTLYHEKLDDVQVLCEECHLAADYQRRQSNVSEANENAFVTWATKKYGEESLYEMDEMRLYDEFEDWLEWKEREGYY